MEKESERGMDGGRERRREGKAKLGRTGLKEGLERDWLNAYLTEFVKINIFFVFDSLYRRLYFNFWKRCIQFKYDSMAHHPNRVQSLHCVSLA